MTDQQITSLERALVAHVLAMLVSIEDLPEDQVELDTAVGLEEHIAAAVHALTEEDRARFLRIALALADDADLRGKETGHGLREALDWIGLLETP